MLNLEDTVDVVQDGMMALEIQNDEMQLRLTELEETRTLGLVRKFSLSFSFFSLVTQISEFIRCYWSHDEKY